MHPTHIQEHAVKSIIDKYDQKIKSIYFKAPTGCGKTFIICNVISRLIKRIKNCGKTVCFICATISDGDLPKQMLNNFNEYQNYLNELDGYTFLSQYHQSPSIDNKNQCECNCYISPLENGVLIFGKSSFGRKRIFNQENTIGKLINEIKMRHYQLIYIRDEAHIGADENNSHIKNIKNETQNFEQLMKNNADFIIKMTATPEASEENSLVEIKEQDLNRPTDDKYLIKISEELNPHFDEDIDEFTFFKKGINHFKDTVMKSYKDDKDLKDIRPACLIQIDNEPTDVNKRKQWSELLIKIENYMHDELNLQFSEYFSKNDSITNTNQQLSGRYKTLKEPNDPYSLSKNNSLYDCIIFKVAIATGWNIPRACMIIQLRSLTSQKLKTQTLGRIKRNPLKTLANNENAMKYYIWSEVINEKDIKIKKFTFNNSVKLVNSFPKITISNNHDDELDTKKFKNKVNNYLEKNRQIIQIEFDKFKKDKFITYKIQNINKQPIVNKITTCFSLYEIVNKLIKDNIKIYNLIKQIINRQWKKTSISNLLIYEYIVFMNQYEYIYEIQNFYNDCLDKQTRLFDNYLLLNNNKLPTEITQKYNISSDNNDNENKIIIQDFSNFFMNHLMKIEKNLK